MIGLGTLINFVAIIIGAIIGTLLGDRLKKNTRNLVTDALGLVTMLIAGLSVFDVTKKELAEQTGPGRKSTTQIIQKESDWKNYFGSEEYIKKLIKEGKQEEFTREIIQLVPNKKLLTYYECKYLFHYGVLEHPVEYFNDNILGKFFSKDFL